MAPKDQHAWVQEPLIACAPMRLISLEDLAASVTLAGGLGFIGAGSDTSGMDKTLARARSILVTGGLPVTESDCLPVGIGFLNWGADLRHAVDLVAKHKPCAVWLFAARTPAQMQEWSTSMRKASPRTKIWIQISTVRAAIETVKDCQPDVLVVQGTDAGGHGLTHAGASLMSILPEVIDALEEQGSILRRPIIVAAGGITDGRGVAAAMALGAHGVVMGTRFLAAKEAILPKGYRRAVLDASDGGVTTVRTNVYDQLRGTTDWPAGYGGRGIINKSYVDALAGMCMADNKRLYETALTSGVGGWGTQGRLTTYAGTGIGLVRKVMPAGEIVRTVRADAIRVLQARSNWACAVSKPRL